MSVPHVSHFQKVGVRLMFNLMFYFWSVYPVQLGSACDAFEKKW